MRYFAYDGMDKTEIKASSVVAVDDDGIEYELHWRSLDKKMSLSVSHGRLVIWPVASNVVRVSQKK